MENEQLIIDIRCQGATTVPLEELVDLQGNLKDLTEQNYVKLRNSITKFGFSFPVQMWIDPIDGKKYIIDAHQRVRTLRKMQQEGWTIPPLPADLIHAKDRVEAKKKLLLLNSRYGQMTREGFDEFVDEVGFEIDDDIDDLLVLPEIELFGEDAKTDVIEDEAPEVSQEPAVSQLGQVYQLGKHRLMCGDATKIEDVEKLMNGQKADMVFTDPPYGISIVSKDGSVGGGTEGKYRPILNDGNTQVAIDAYNLAASLQIPKLLFFGGNYYATSLPNSSCWLVWDKQDGKHVTFADCELVWTNFNSPARIYTHVWDGFRRDSEQGEMRSHPTQKPIALLANIMKDYGSPEEKVLDLFGGSGSTLIACEQTNRICYMMELDPKYCDVIRKRYAKFIGQEEDWQSITPIVNI